MDKQDVVERVARAVEEKRSRFSDFPALEIVANETVEDRGWFQVTVHPHDRRMRAYHYYDHLTEIERQLRADGINVILIPGRLHRSAEPHR